MNTNTSMQRFQTRTKEKGQALVLIAMLIVILLAALGLAIDGGGMFLLWRDAQNAVDAAALQAAFSYCTNGQDLVSAQNAGYTAALMNGFNNKVDNWVVVDRAVSLVDEDELPGNASIKNDIIMVQIKAEKPAYFIQLVYGGPMTVEVSALGVCNASGDNFFEDFSVYSMGSEGMCGDPYEETSMNGNTGHFFSNIGSNDDLGVYGNDYNFYNNAGIKYVDGFEGGAKVENEPDGGDVPGTEEGVAEQAYSDFPVLYTWDQFVPDTGEIWNAIDGLDGEFGNWEEDPNLHYTTSTMPFNDANMQGLYVINNTGLSVAGKDFTVGPKGITIVTMGSFSAQGNVNSKDTTNLWKPFTTSAGVTNSLFIFSAKNTSGVVPPKPCPKNNEYALQFSGSGIVAEGIIYAPYSRVDWSSSQSYYCGAIISIAFDGQASNKWFFGDEIPADEVLEDLGAADWFIDGNFEGRNCDFFESASPSIFLGDIQK